MPAKKKAAKTVAKKAAAPEPTMNDLLDDFDKSTRDLLDSAKPGEIRHLVAQMKARFKNAVHGARVRYLANRKGQ